MALNHDINAWVFLNYKIPPGVTFFTSLLQSPQRAYNPAHRLTPWHCWQNTGYALHSSCHVFSWLEHDVECLVEQPPPSWVPVSPQGLLPLVEGGSSQHRPQQGEGSISKGIPRFWWVVSRNPLHPGLAESSSPLTPARGAWGSTLLSSLENPRELKGLWFPSSGAWSRKEIGRGRGLQAGTEMPTFHNSPFNFSIK